MDYDPKDKWAERLYHEAAQLWGNTPVPPHILSTGNEYSVTDIFDLMRELADGAPWPEEIFKLETPLGKQAILEAFAIGYAKRM